MIVAGICRKHGFWNGEGCTICDAEKPKNTVHINTYDWIKQGTWEHIDPAMPNMRIESKEQLKKECESRGVIPKALMKPKSQGKGFEIARR